MLTRCTKGMVIVSNQFFAMRCARKTLLGKLAAHWVQKGAAWIDWRLVTSQMADLPGAVSPKRFASSAASQPTITSGTIQTVRKVDDRVMAQVTQQLSRAVISGVAAQAVPKKKAKNCKTKVACPPAGTKKKQKGKVSVKA